MQHDDDRPIEEFNGEERRRPRTPLEYKAMRAQARLPLAAISLALALLVQVFGGLWMAATAFEQLRSIISNQMEARRSIDLLRESMPTPRDMETIQKLLADHEGRLRDVERRVAANSLRLQKGETLQ